jgi:hypothetical protein
LVRKRSAVRSSGGTPAPAVRAQPADAPIAFVASRTVPDLVGKKLNKAEAELDSKGIGFKTEGGGIFGIVVKSDWGVCDTTPHAGKPVHGPVKLIVGHFACGA